MGRFHNLDPWMPRGALDILRWEVVDTIAGKRRRDRNERFETPRVDNDGRALHAMTPSLTWIGHATFVLRLGGLFVATDPIWSDALGFASRTKAPPITPATPVGSVTSRRSERASDRSIGRCSPSAPTIRNGS